MFDTNLVVVGNVLVAPEWRRFENSGSVVANFRIASTARRFDREINDWVDGNSLRIRVTAWRRLAEGVISSLSVGDPVIVYGRLYTRDWKDDNGNNRISYEMEAYSIGHDLARGRGRFTRNRTTPDQGAGAIDEQVFVGGEPTMPVPIEDAPSFFGEGVPSEEAPAFAEIEAAAKSDESPSDESPSGESSSDESRSGESPTDEEIALEVERLTAAEPTPSRRTRRSRKEPVAA
ncbi:single-stranded DNA-binding protein [Actinoplanes sp. LDG1-06]|uniref:Single-stranded DNA-binding protein n=1 Tax=Paractinoplanes ovalisporus TaxID=2810368 RepID=A0ABS2AWH3_9ACTN|nr:single-stranded DNA-binding protein [Actinoplanes ovalisporus]MBM2623571.1 single-stranded DNA-binding protein [Actinoplanes ovalisporus]